VKTFTLALMLSIVSFSAPLIFAGSALADYRLAGLAASTKLNAPWKIEPDPPSKAFRPDYDSKPTPPARPVARGETASRETLKNQAMILGRKVGTNAIGFLAIA
jgi:hypothetical protein